MSVRKTRIHSSFLQAVFVTVVGFVALTGVRVAAQEPQLKTTLDLTPPGIQPLNADSLLAAVTYGERAGGSPPVTVPSSTFPVALCAPRPRSGACRRRPPPGGLRWATSSYACRRGCSA